ncbi:hypothetical protein SAMN05421833_15125 [Microbispora rosea]|uniref:Transposase DDE domain-containing protein n=1 Tax=Microbispora rosea TaxID=58117 RepID=A0A1N7HHU0_9ACTN|nr:hypothetical protein [Microbispora rosea]GIH51957.1 hypothetical protein Mro03_71360 [Microbispora rosea subsp. rosea]SIS24444.1 hypothetical protein SAMN05421833_15125 [Microbispora rosea]
MERTLAWLTACRRLARDYESHPEVSEAIIRWAAIAGMARRITRGEPARHSPRYTFNSELTTKLDMTATQSDIQLEAHRVPYPQL